MAQNYVLFILFVCLFCKFCYYEVNRKLPELSVEFSLYLNPLSVNPTKWSNTLKQFVGNS